MKVKAVMKRGALKKLSSTQLQALSMTADAIKTDVMTAAVVPKKTGELERSGFIDESEIKKGLVKLTYDTPYARRLYWHPEYKFSQDLNANAQGKWLEEWLSGENKDFASDTFKKLYQRLNRGTIH